MISVTNMSSESHVYIQILILCNSFNPDTLSYVQDQNITSNINFELPSCDDRLNPRIPTTSVKFLEFEKEKLSRFRGITFEALFSSKKRK